MYGGRLDSYFLGEIFKGSAAKGERGGKPEEELGKKGGGSAHGPRSSNGQGHETRRRYDVYAKKYGACRNYFWKAVGIRSSVIRRYHWGRINTRKRVMVAGCGASGAVCRTKARERTTLHSGRGLSGMGRAGVDDWSGADIRRKGEGKGVSLP